MMVGRTRGQMALMGLAAVAFVVIMIVYMMSGGQQTETEIRIKDIQSAGLKSELEKVETIVSDIFEESIHSSALELARHGGYAKGNIPPRSLGQTPYWFYRGNIVNIPSVEVMTGMMKERMEWRISNELNDLRKNLRMNMFRIGQPSVTVTLTDVQINANMELPINVVQGENKLKTKIEFTHTATLRLKKLRDLAEEYVREYENARYMESQWEHGVNNDPRVPETIGAGAAETGPCSHCQVVKFTKAGMTEALKEHAQLHASMELQRARGLPFFKEDAAGAAVKDIQLDFKVNPQHLNFEFTANRGEDCESNTEVKLINWGNPGAFPTGQCQHSYMVDYDLLEFPVEIIIRDLLKIGMAMTTETVASTSDQEESGTKSIVKPLEFRIVMDSYLKTGDPRAVDGSVTDPETVDNLCQGACSIDITATNANEGTLFIDSCEYGPGKHFTESNVPCGIHTITFTAIDPPGKAKFVKQDNIKENYQLDIEVQDYASVKGTINMKNKVYCTKSKRVEDKGLETLAYYEGDPPRTIRLFFYPVNHRLGEMVHADIDKNGNYEVPVINPGTYLVLAFPTEDASNRPTHKVLPKGLVMDIQPGSNDLSIELEPLRVEKVGDKFVNVVGSEDC
ncbi:MAG: hypothetical protein QF415_03610 [Candidatus Undinarchaeales archaeon]|nr:hypothetical protein [Candidatus Undinarchaeales archaeon]MDP7493694.1 hypothetical protein [Candidatus Undinarchaeales archaeon]